MQLALHPPQQGPALRSGPLSSSASELAKGAVSRARSSRNPGPLRAHPDACRACRRASCLPAETKNRGRGGWERNEPAAWARRLLLSHYPTPAVPLRVSGSQRSRGDQQLNLRRERQVRHPKPCRLLVAVLRVSKLNRTTLQYRRACRPSRRD